LTFTDLKRVILLVEPFVDGDYCVAADKNEISIQVLPLPPKAIRQLVRMGVSFESGIRTNGGTLTLYP